MANLQSIKQRFGIIGRSPLLDRALSTAERVSSTDLSVLITGESGVGKEVFSKIIHSLSARKHNKFIAINTGALPAGTINSELFGHEKGAFTGATAERKGYFETVSGGTIFLDEIGEMPLDTQAFLLRVLESGEFLRVGSSNVLKTDVRVIAATNVNLEKKVRDGKFREDLYYRLNTVPIQVPSLKERSEDVPLLFRKFALDFAEKYRTDPVRLDERAELLMQNYQWPGNIRELRNIVEQLSVLAEDRRITAEKVLDLIPSIAQRNLPMIRENGSQSQGNNFQEREILYKLLFEMKSDLNDLKSLVFELIQRNNLRVPNLDSFKQLGTPTAAVPAVEEPAAGFAANEDFTYTERKEVTNGFEPEEKAPYQPIILNQKDEAYDNAEVVEESLSLEDMEKELIKKALKKHKGRRKDAAHDLGISERTLYRKINQYQL